MSDMLDNKQSSAAALSCVYVVSEDRPKLSEAAFRYGDSVSLAPVISCFSASIKWLFLVLLRVSRLCGH